MRLLHQLVTLEVFSLSFPSSPPLCPPKAYFRDSEGITSVDAGS